MAKARQGFGVEMTRRAWLLSGLLALPLGLAGCIGPDAQAISEGLPGSTASQFPPVDEEVIVDYAVMGGPTSMGDMGMVEIAAPAGANVFNATITWTPSPTETGPQIAMMHAGGMMQQGPMLASDRGRSPIELGPAFIPDNESALTLMIMPESEPVGVTVRQVFLVHVEFAYASPPPRAPQTWMDLTLGAGDGLLNVSRWEPAQVKGSVLLVGGGREPRSVWEGYAVRLRNESYRAWAIDGMDVDEAAKISLAASALRVLAPDGFKIVGASLGAEAALVAAVVEPCVAGVAQLSPVRDPSDQTRPVKAFNDYGDRPVFIAAALQDGASWPSAQENRLLARGDVTYVEAQGNAHGTDLLEDTAVEAALTAWLKTPASTGC